VVGGANAEVLAVDLVVVGTGAEEGVGTWLVEMELGRAS
jgi:hypothetical protein